MDWLTNLAASLGQKWGANSATKFADTSLGSRIVSGLQEDVKTASNFAQDASIGLNMQYKLFTAPLHMGQAAITSEAPSWTQRWRDIVGAIDVSPKPIFQKVIEDVGITNPWFAQALTIPESFAEWDALIGNPMAKTTLGALSQKVNKYTPQSINYTIIDNALKRLQAVPDYTSKLARVNTVVGAKMPGFNLETAIIQGGLHDLAKISYWDKLKLGIMGPGTRRGQVSIPGQKEFFNIGYGIKDAFKGAPTPENLVGWIGKLAGKLPGLEGVDITPTVQEFQSRKEADKKGIGAYGSATKVGSGYEIQLNKIFGIDKSSKGNILKDTTAEELAHIFVQKSGGYTDIIKAWEQGLISDAEASKLSHTPVWQEIKDKYAKEIRNAIVKETYTPKEIFAPPAPVFQSSFKEGLLTALGKQTQVYSHGGPFLSNNLSPWENYINNAPVVRGVYLPNDNVVGWGSNNYSHIQIQMGMEQKHRLAPSSSPIHFLYGTPSLAKQEWGVRYGNNTPGIYAVPMANNVYKPNTGEFNATIRNEFEQLRYHLLSQGMPSSTPFYPLTPEYIEETSDYRGIYYHNIAPIKSTLGKPIYKLEAFKDNRGPSFQQAIEAPIPESPSKEQLDLFGSPMANQLPIGPPSSENQLQFNFQPEDMPARNFREIGTGAALSNKIVIASHAGIGPEIQMLASALDRKAQAMQTNQLLKQQLNKVFDKYTNWLDRSKASLTNKPSPLKEKVFTILENPTIDWTSTEVTSLPQPIQEIMRTIHQDQLAFFWEENRIRLARGDEPYPLRHGYMMHILEAKVRDSIRRGIPVSGEILAPFGRRLNMNMFLSAAEQRTGTNLEIIKDPILTYIARRNLHDNYTILQPALDEAIASLRTLQASENPPPMTVARFFEEYVKTDVKGQITPFDRMLNASIAIPVRLVNLIMSPFGRTLGANPSSKLAKGALGMQYLGTLWGVTRLFSQNILQSIHQVGMYGPVAATKAFGAMMQGTCFGVWEAFKNIFHPMQAFQRGWLRSPVGQTTAHLSEVTTRFANQAQELDTSAKALLLKAGWMPLKSSDMLNVVHGGETAYLAAKEWQADAKFQAECRRLAVTDGVPADSYLWTDEDCINEANFGIMCTQYKYTPSASPALYRTVVGKLLGSLQSWTINYWGTFWRELIYRAYEGRTGWSTSEGYHKPIPTKARAGAVMYLLAAAAVIGATSALGFDYSRQFLFGTLPSRLSPAGTVIAGTGTYLVGLAQNDTAMMKRGLYDMKRGGQAFIPGAGAKRQIERVVEEGPGAAVFYYPQKGKTVLPTRAAVRRSVTKGMEIPSKLTLNRMLNLK